jgi:hypothetical protein
MTETPSVKFEQVTLALEWAGIIDAGGTSRPPKP